MCMYWLLHVFFRISLVNNRVVVLSIHQPRYSIYKQFDTLTLLSQGELVYHGRQYAVLDHFKELGKKMKITWHFISLFISPPSLSPAIYQVMYVRSMIIQLISYWMLLIVLKYKWKNKATLKVNGSTHKKLILGDLLTFCNY